MAALIEVENLVRKTLIANLDLGRTESTESDDFVFGDVVGSRLERQADASRTRGLVLALGAPERIPRRRFGGFDGARRVPRFCEIGNDPVIAVLTESSIDSVGHIFEIELRAPVSVTRSHAAAEVVQSFERLRQEPNLIGLAIERPRTAENDELHFVGGMPDPVERVEARKRLIVRIELMHGRALSSWLAREIALRHLDVARAEDAFPGTWKRLRQNRDGRDTAQRAHRLHAQLLDDRLALSGPLMAFGEKAIAGNELAA